MKFFNQRSRVLGLGLVAATLMWGIVGCGNLGGTADEALGVDPTQQATTVTLFGRLYAADSGAKAVLRFDGASGDVGNIPPGAIFTGNLTTLVSPKGVQLQTIGDHLVIADDTANPTNAANPGAIVEYDGASQYIGTVNLAANNTISATTGLPTGREITGANTGLNGPTAAVIASVGSFTLLNGSPTADPTILYVLNKGANNILNFANAETTATGNVAPQATITDSSGALTGANHLALDESISLALAGGNTAEVNRLYVANPANGTVSIYPNAGTLTGDQAGNAQVVHMTGLGTFRTPTQVALNLNSDNQLFITDPGAGLIYLYNNAFEITADRGPDQSITIGATGLTIDFSLDILYTVSSNSARIQDFAGAETLETGINETPVVIQGNLTGLNTPQGLALDPNR